MKQRRFAIRLLAATTIAMLTVTACRGGGPEASSGDSPGVTTKPCPKPVNPNNGCIYLGIISDLTRGPFAPIAVPATDAQRAFWARVNTQGGVGGYDIDVETHIADAEYNPELHNRRYQEMRGEVLALAQTLGSSQTMAILNDMKSDQVIGVPASFNSGWNFEPQILQSGANYCFETMNGVDWAVSKRGVRGKVLAIHYPNDYGRDAATGVEAAAKKNGLEFVDVETPTGQDNQAGAVAAITQHQPSLVVISTGPAEMATIVGGAAAQKWRGTVVGSSVTWNAALLQSPAAPALEAMYFNVGAWGSWGSDTPAHRAMREALGSQVKPSDGYTGGWMWSYPMLAALRAAAQLEGGITRKNLVTASKNLTSVDYEGALPAEAGNLSGSPATSAWRSNLINRIDKTAPTGLGEVAPMDSGPTAQGYDFSKPCVALR